MGTTGTLVFSAPNNGFGLTIKKNFITKKDETITQRHKLENGSITPSIPLSNTYNYIYTSTASDILNLKCEVYKLDIQDVISKWVGTITSYSGNESSIPQNGSITTVSFIGPYPVSTELETISIAVTESSVVPFCPFIISKNKYTIVINPDFALIDARQNSTYEFREGILNQNTSNIRKGTGNIVSTAYVCKPGLYIAGKKNYAAVWDFVKQSDGKVRPIKRDTFVSGSTKKDTGVTSGVLQAVQYFD
jgi:hypothetical protein